MTRCRPQSRRLSWGLRKVCSAALLLWVCALLEGCPIFPIYGHPDQIGPFLDQVDGHPNTYRMFVLPVFRNQEDYVKAVTVIDSIEKYRGKIVIYWEIRATERVSMHGFQVELGCVPKGFEQTVPEGGAKFTPEAGRLYDVHVSLEKYDALTTRRCR